MTYDPDVVRAGADPTGRVPSDPAFERTIAAAASQGGGRIWCPATGNGGYLLTRPLPLAALADRPVSMEGDGQAWENGTGTILIPDTESAPAIDATGSSAFRMARLTLKSQSRTRGAKLLVLAGRTAAWPFPQGHHYEDVILHAGTDPASNGGVGTIGLANISCEHFHAANVRIKADVPFYFHGFNDLRVTAPHGGTLTGPWSMTMITLLNCSGYAWHGPAYDFADCANFLLLNCHAQRDSGSRQAHAFRLSGRVQALRMIGGQVEQFPALALLAGDVTGAEFNIMIGSATQPYLELAAGITLEACSFRISQINGVKQALFSNTAATIAGGTIHLERGQRVVDADGAPRLTLQGVTIHSADDAPVHVTSRSNYVVVSPAGWQAVEAAASGRQHF